MIVLTKVQKKARNFLSIIVATLLVILLSIAIVPPLPFYHQQIKFQPPANWLGAINNFGGFFGGILGPIVAVAGFYFLYITHKSQEETQSIALLDKLYNNLLEDIRSLYYREQKLDKSGHLQSEKVHEGIDALYNYKPVANGNSVLNHLNLIINSFNILISQTNKYMTDNSDDIYEKLLDKAYLMYHAKILWPVLEGLYKYKIEIFTKDWGSPEILFFEFEKLTKESFNYLSSKGLVKAYTRKKHNNDIVNYLEIILNTTYDTLDSRHRWLADTELLINKFGIAPSSSRMKIGIIIKWLLPTDMAEILRLAFRPALNPVTFSPIIPNPPFPLVERSKSWWLRQFDRHEEAMRKRHS